MRALAALALSLIPAAAFAQPASDIPAIHYKAVAEWPKPLVGDKGLAAGPWNYIQVTSVAVMKNGNILVMHRGDDPLLEYKPDGTLVGPFGDVKFSHGKVMPMLKEVAAAGRNPATMSGYQAVYGAAGCSNCGAHEVRVDPQGNVWAVDAPGQVIVKMNASGHTVMTMGTRDKRGKSHELFYLPTDIAFAPNGELIVTDGYGNDRVMRFTAQGKYLGEFGARGNGPGQFQLPHNAVVDAKGLIYITDRDNQRVEVFDLHRQIPAPMGACGRPVVLDHDAGPACLGGRRAARPGRQGHRTASGGRRRRPRPWRRGGSERRCLSGIAERHGAEIRTQLTARIRLRCKAPRHWAR